MSDIKIQLGADTSEADSALRKLKGSFDELGEGAKKNQKAFKDLGDILRFTPVAAAIGTVIKVFSSAYVEAKKLGDAGTSAQKAFVAVGDSIGNFRVEYLKVAAEWAGKLATNLGLVESKEVKVSFSEESIKIQQQAIANAAKATKSAQISAIDPTDKLKEVITINERIAAQERIINELRKQGNTEQANKERITLSDLKIQRAKLSSELIESTFKSRKELNDALEKLSRDEQLKRMSSSELSKYASEQIQKSNSGNLLNEYKVDRTLSPERRMEIASSITESDVDRRLREEKDKLAENRRKQEELASFTNAAKLVGSNIIPFLGIKGVESLGPTAARFAPSGTSAASIKAAEKLKQLDSLNLVDDASVITGGGRFTQFLDNRLLQVSKYVSKLSSVAKVAGPLTLPLTGVAVGSDVNKTMKNQITLRNEELKIQNNINDLQKEANEPENQKLERQKVLLKLYEDSERAQGQIFDLSKQTSGQNKKLLKELIDQEDARKRAIEAIQMIAAKEEEESKQKSENDKKKTEDDKKKSDEINKLKFDRLKTIDKLTQKEIEYLDVTEEGTEGELKRQRILTEILDLRKKLTDENKKEKELIDKANKLKFEYSGKERTRKDIIKEGREQRAISSDITKSEQERIAAVEKQIQLKKELKDLDEKNLSKLKDSLAQEDYEIGDDGKLRRKGKKAILSAKDFARVDAARRKAIADAARTGQPADDKKFLTIAEKQARAIDDIRDALAVQQKL
jgi:hypothetical protein